MAESLDAPTSDVTIPHPNPLDDPNANTSILEPKSDFDSAIISYSTIIPIDPPI